MQHCSLHIRVLAWFTATLEVVNRKELLDGEVLLLNFACS